MAYVQVNAKEMDEVIKSFVRETAKTEKPLNKNKLYKAIWTTKQNIYIIKKTWGMWYDTFMKFKKYSKKTWFPLTFVIE